MFDPKSGLLEAPRSLVCRVTSVSAASSSLKTDILDFSTFPGRKNKIVEFLDLAPGVIKPVISRLAIKVWRLWVKSSPTPRIHLKGSGLEMIIRSKSYLSSFKLASSGAFLPFLSKSKDLT